MADNCCCISSAAYTLTKHIVSSLPLSATIFNMFRLIDIETTSWGSIDGDSNKHVEIMICAMHHLVSLIWTVSPAKHVSFMHRPSVNTALDMC